MALALYRLARPAGARINMTQVGDVCFDVRIVWHGDKAKVLALVKEPT